MIPGAQKRKADFTDVVMYVAIASKHLRLIILLITFSLAAGLIFYIFSRPVYFSKSIVRYTAIGSPVPDKDSTLRGEDPRRFNDDRFLGDFESDHIIKRTDQRLSGYTDGTQLRKAALKQVRTTWTTDRNIELNVWAYSPALVTTFPEAMIEEFQKDRDERAMFQYRALTNKFVPQLNQLWGLLQAQMADGSQLDSSYTPEKLRHELEQLRLVPEQLEQYRNRFRQWEYVANKLQNPVYSDVDRLRFHASIDYARDAGAYLEVTPEQKSRLSPGSRPPNGTIIVPRTSTRSDREDWFGLEREKLLLEGQIRDGLITYRPTHPKMAEFYRKAEALQKKLKEEVARSLTDFEIHGRWLAQKIREFEEQLPEIKTREKRFEEYMNSKTLKDLSKVPYQQMIADLTTEMKRHELALSNERVELKFLKFDNLRDEIPISPDRLKIVLLFLGIGVGLAIGVPFLLEFMDQTVTNMEKMEETTNMRGLGLVPDFEDEIAEAYPLIFSDGVANPDFIENFRVIRTNLLSSAASSKFPQVIMVTSTSPKEGKTVVASNLAMSFAHMGEKTLIIDANLRRGIQHHLFGSRSAPGLSNILVEKYDVADACRPTTMENLHILPCGDQLEGDIEQLGSPNFAAAIEKLRKRYQRIVVDATPVLGLAETSVMQTAMDGVVLVIWSGQTPTRAVRTAIDILNDNHANFYGFILNRLDLTATMNRFHYYYYTNHYYNRYQSLTRAPNS